MMHARPLYPCRHAPLTSRAERRNGGRFDGCLQTRARFLGLLLAELLVMAGARLFGKRIEHLLIVDQFDRSRYRDNQLEFHLDI
jgi:hypothetical protein